MGSDLMPTAMGALGAAPVLTKSRPTTREVFGSKSATTDEQDALERAFFLRVVLPNGTFKTTSTDRIDDLNRAVLAHIATIPERPVKIMDVGVSSGVSTLEWYESLSIENIDCKITATDLTVYASLLSLTPNLAVLIDRNRNILHLDVFGRGAPPTGRGLQGLLAGAVRGLFRVAMTADRNLPPLNGHTQEAATGWLLNCEPVALLTKKLVQHEGLRVVEDDLLAMNRPEFIEAFHVLRAANILNRAYFSDAVLTQIIKTLKKRLTQNGLLIICRTTEEGVNHATVFRLATASEFRVLLRLGQGSEIEDLVTAT